MSTGVMSPKKLGGRSPAISIEELNGLAEQGYTCLILSRRDRSIVGKGATEKEAWDQATTAGSDDKEYDGTTAYAFNIQPGMITVKVRDSVNELSSRA